MAASIENLLKLLLVPDNNVILQATSQLREAFKNPAIVEALLAVVSTSENVQVRQYAAVLLRRKFSKRKQWAKTDDNIKEGLKSSFLQILLQEPEKLVKNSIAQVIGVLAKHELPKGKWPQLLQFLNNLSNSSNPAEKEIGLFTLSVVSSVASVQLKPYLTGLLTLFTKTLQEANQNVAFYTIQVLTNLASTVGTDELNKFQSLIPLVMNIICSILVSNEEQMSEALDIFEELMDCEVAIVVPYIRPLVEMCLKITVNVGLQDNTRVKAMSVIYKLIRLKKKSIVKHKLIGPIVEVLFPIMCAPTSQDLDSEPSTENEVDSDHDDDDDDQSPVSFAPQVLNMMALNLPPEKLMVPLLSHLEPAFLSGNPYPRKAGYLTIAVLAEGCSENIRSKYLQSFLQIICKGIKDPHPVVKNYALFALGQFAEYLQPDVCNYHSEIMPLLFDYLTDTCRQLQQGAKDPPNMSRTFYAMETYCESLGNLLIPYLPNFIKCILTFLTDTNSVSAKELAISAIGAAGNATKEAVVPYFPAIIDCLKPYLAEPQSEHAPLQIQSIDTLGVLARTIGPNNFLPMAHDSVKMGLALIETVQDPDLRRSVYGLFASVSSVLKNEMEPYMSSIIRFMLDSLISTEGIVPEYDSANGAFMLFEESEEEEEETPEEEDIGDDDNQDDTDDEDDDVVGFNVENAYLEEKEDTCWALKEISSNTGQIFLPYFESCFEQVKKLIDHPDSDVRKSALVTLGYFCIALHKTTSQTNTLQAFQQCIGVYLPKLICTCREDTELEVVSAGVETLNELLKEAKQNMLDANSLEAIVKLIQDTFAEKLSCQDDSEVKEDEQEAEYDSLLIEFIGELIPTLTKILPHQQFMPHLQALISRLVAKANPKNSVSDKSFSLGTLAEVVEAIGPTGGLLSLVPTLEPVFLKGMKDEDDEVRSNSVFGLGVMVQYAGDALIPHYPTLLQALSTMLLKENNPRARDNICGAVARFIMTKTEAIPMKEVFPVFLQCLPLTEDFEENLTVYKCIHFLYSLRHEIIAMNLSPLLRIISTVLSASTTDTETKCLLVEVTKAVCQDFPTEFENILSTFPPESQQVLKDVLTH